MAIEFKQADKPTKSTAARKVVQRRENAPLDRSIAASRNGVTNSCGGESRRNSIPAGTQALPVDTPSKALFNRNAYQAQYMRDKRAADKLGMTVAKYRACQASPTDAT